MNRNIHALITLALMVLFLQLGSLRSVLDRLSIDQQELAIGIGTLTFGSLLGLQLFALHNHARPDQPPVHLGINIGGAVVPLGFVLFFVHQYPVNIGNLILLSLLVAAVVYPMTRVDKKQGVVIYLFGSVACAATGAILMAPENPLVLAYAAAVCGTLIGGDLLHLPQLKKLIAQERETVFIGGGGILDAIFLSGLFAMLTADTLQQYNLMPS